MRLTHSHSSAFLMFPAAACSMMWSIQIVQEIYSQNGFISTGCRRPPSSLEHVHSRIQTQTHAYASTHARPASKRCDVALCMQCWHLALAVRFRCRKVVTLRSMYAASLSSASLQQSRTGCQRLQWSLTLQRLDTALSNINFK